MIQTLLISSTTSLQVSGSLHVYSLKNHIHPFFRFSFATCYVTHFGSKKFLADFQDNGV